MATDGLHYPFADNFWGNEEASIQVIVERSRRSKQTSEQIRRLFEKRAQLEEEYGDRLLQIAQSPIGDHEEYGSTFSETLNDIPAATEAAARAHLDLAQQIKHHLELPLSTFVKEQKEVRQASLSKIEDARKQKAFFVSTATKAKDTYEIQCQHLVEMRQRLEDRSQQVGQEDIAKLQEQVAQTDKEYKQSIQLLSTAYTQWYDEWRDVCDIFQSLEERRLHYLRSSLWAYANMMSSVHTIDDQSCERIRTSLESMEVSKDLDLFVQKRRTGQTPPEPAKYENYFEKFKSANKRSDIAIGSIVKPLPPIAPPGSLWGTKTADSEAKSKPKEEPEAKQIREITIPVVDEELRSVDVQLKRLPTMRTITGESSLLSLTETPVPSLPSNGLGTVARPSTESRRRSKELVEIAVDPMTEAELPAEEFNADVNGKSKSGSQNSNDGSVSDFIISRSSIPRGTVNDLGSSTNMGGSHKDDASSSPANHTEAATTTTAAAEPRLSAGPSSPKNERRVSALLTRPPPLITALNDPKSTLMASPLSIKRPMPGPVNTRNLNATTTVDMSQPNSALTHESHITETSTKVASPQPLIHAAKISSPPQAAITTPSTSAGLSPESTMSARAASPPQSSPTRRHGQNHRHNESTTPYMYTATTSNEQDVDLGIRPPPWGVDTSHQDQSELASTALPSETSPFLARAAATMMKFPDQPKDIIQRNVSPNLDVPSSSPLMMSKSPSLASKMKFAFNKSPSGGSVLPEKAHTSDMMLMASKSESDSRVAAARSATDPSTMPVHQIERLKERSNSRFSLSIFKRDKEGKKHRDKNRHMAHTEQESAPSLLSHTMSDNDSGHLQQQQQQSQGGSVPRSPGGSRGPDSSLGLGPVSSTTPELSWSSQQQPKQPSQGVLTEPIHITQRMSSLGMEQLRQRQSPADTPVSVPSWQPSATLADGTPILEYVQALWSYKAQIPDTEISFETNDVLAVITKQQDGWWEAEILDQRRRRRGLVPSNFMKLLKSL